MAGPGEIEIQLGHLCNDRCVFCASGRLTHAGQAPVLSLDTLASRVREAYAAGHRRITFLGGEPTIQPAFLDVVRVAVDLGYESIVIFTNGSKAGRTDLIDRVLETGGNFEWRFSVQGGTREAHERTTGRKGGFDQVLRALDHARARGQRTTVNMCLVTQNYESVDGYPALLAPFGIAQLHLDVLNPQDTGELGPGELADIMPRHSDVAGPLERMVRAFPSEVEISIGSLPYCVAPELAPWIHHDHLPMWTVTARDGATNLRPARYLARGNTKTKPSSCGSCVFDERCTGVFRAYADRYGTDELRPITAERAASLESYHRLVAVRLRPWLREGLAEIAPWATRIAVEEVSLREVFVTMTDASGAELRVLLFDRRDNAVAASDWCTLRIERCSVDPATALDSLRRLWSRLERQGMRTAFPPGEDALMPAHPSIVQRLRMLRERAPFGSMVWTATRVLSGGSRVEATLRSPDDGPVTVWLAAEGARSTGGYQVSDAPSPATRDGLRRVLEALGHA
jgi:MoaA/NifB/PqqE/SkfB family radical SAM enzyme